MDRKKILLIYRIIWPIAVIALLIIYMMNYTSVFSGRTDNMENGEEVLQTQEPISEEDERIEDGESEEEGEAEETSSERLHVTITISEYYITNTGDPGNLYYIDDQNILWGCGFNQYGQLGQGTQDNDFHAEMVKIAENVVHVDYSQAGFTIYLTEDHNLYGFGNGGRGALMQLASMTEEIYMNPDKYAITEPILLMEDVVYARCGKGDIAAIKSDSSVWTWGIIWYEGQGRHSYQQEPIKILENAVLVTGDWYNHAALLEDGTVWTWGYNYSGNCGIADMPLVFPPQKVAEGVIMVWTGSMRYHVDCYDITEFEEYERPMENTIIQKADGSYWICGAGVGDEEKLLPYYYEWLDDYYMICTHEFLPYHME